MKNKIQNKNLLIDPSFEDIEIADSHYGMVKNIFHTQENFVKWINFFDFVKKNISKVGDDLVIDPIQVYISGYERGSDFSDFPENLLEDEVFEKENLVNSCIHTKYIVGDFCEYFINNEIENNINHCFYFDKCLEIGDFFRKHIINITIAFFEDDEYEACGLVPDICFEKRHETAIIVQEKLNELSKIFYYNGIKHQDYTNFKNLDYDRIAEEIVEWENNPLISEPVSEPLLN
jgi:hypothetical protein